VRKAKLDEFNLGINMGGRKINDLRYVYDTTLIDTSEEDLLT
jgi:hypothetical protein